MIAISTNVVENAIIKFKPAIARFSILSKARIAKLLIDPKSKLSISQKKYLTNLEANYDKIITGSPHTLNRLKKTFPLPKSKTKDEKKKFKDKILKALGYSKLRSEFYPAFFQEIGIKACIYCNAHLTVSVEKDKKTKNRKTVKVLLAKFQVDHYLPQSEFPCFSTSLFNLYPSCASCNHAKSDDPVNFKFYLPQKSIKKSDFKFSLDKASITKYILSRNANDIIVAFSEPTPPRGSQSFDETFAIESVYNTQKDLAEELILKAEVYTPTYKKTLMARFSGIFTNPSITNRLIVGNYVDESDIHKRPMAKFTQDVSEQLGLI